MTPTCRYGHGELVRADPPDEHVFVLSSMKRTRLPDGNGGSVDIMFRPSEPFYTLAVFQCQTCGYVELFDEDAFK